MAFTIVGLNRTAKWKKHSLSLFISEEYLPSKERDASGNVLPNQEWQHPAPEELHYCRVGTLVSDGRVFDLVEAVLSLGAAETGGHCRVLLAQEASWLKSQIETWSERAEREQQQCAELAQQELAREAAKAPVFEDCPRCGEATESCKDSRHRGSNKCMKCGGGVGDREHRYCVNCVDLPWREQRERAMGQRIVYSSEE